MTFKITILLYVIIGAISLGMTYYLAQQDWGNNAIITMVAFFWCCLRIFQLLRDERRQR